MNVLVPGRQKRQNDVMLSPTWPLDPLPVPARYTTATAPTAGTAVMTPQSPLAPPRTASQQRPMTRQQGARYATGSQQQQCACRSSAPKVVVRKAPTLVRKAPSAKERRQKEADKLTMALRALNRNVTKVVRLLQEESKRHKGAKRHR